MIFTFVLIALCGIVSADVSEIIKPSREYLPPPSREYLPPSLPKLIATLSTPAITSSYYEDLQTPSTTPSIIIKDISVGSTVAADTIKTTAPAFSDKLIIEKEITSPVPVTITPVTDRFPIQKGYLPPVAATSLVQKLARIAVQNQNLPPVPWIATPNEITINSNADQDDLDILTNIISQPIFSTITVPQTSTILSTDLTPTTAASQPSIITFIPISETTPVSITTQPTSVPEYIQNTSALPTQDNSQNDPIIRINASELSESFDEISELPATLTGVSTPETILSEDGYHYSIPLISFGSLNKN